VKLHALANALLEHETLDREAFELLMDSPEVGTINAPALV